MEPQNPNTYLQEQPQYLPTSDERTMAILAHILALFASIVGPLVIYLVSRNNNQNSLTNKNQSGYVEEHAKESLNFQISMFIIAMISVPLIFLVVGVFMLMAIGFLNLVCIIIASVKASDNKLYRYPLNFRIIK